MPSRRDSNTSSSSLDSIDIRSSPDNHEQSMPIDLTKPVWAVFPSVTVKGKSPIFPPIFTNQREYKQAYYTDGRYPRPFTIDKDQLWSDIYGSAPIKVCIFNDEKDAKTYSFYKTKSSHNDTYTPPVFRIEIHSNDQIEKKDLSYYDRSISYQQRQELSYFKMEIQPSTIQCLETLIFDRRRIDKGQIQEALSFKNKGGRSLDFWRKKWHEAQGNDPHEKSMALLTQYAGKNSLHRFFSGHWRTHNANAVLATLEGLNNDYHLGLTNSNTDEAITQLFADLKTQLKEHQNVLKPSGDLRRILWIIEENTGVSFDDTEKRPDPIIQL